jgi:hypothetical protein
MIGLLLIYFLGKYFYDLAERFDKSKWGFAVLGVVSYYVGTFIGGILLFLFYEIFMTAAIIELNDWVLNLLALPFGLLAAFGLYKFLERRLTNAFNRGTNTIESNILDDDF